MTEPKPKPLSKADDRLVIDMDPEEAVRRLLQADPNVITPEDELVAQDKPLKDQGDKLSS